jgi:hypothetical protein
MANIPVSTAIDNLLKSTPSTTVTTAAALTALGAATTGNASIVAADLATGAVTVDKIGTGAVTEDKIGTGAVTETKIGALAVTDAKLAANAVIEAKIATGAVTETKIATGAVTAAKVTDGALTIAKTSGLRSEVDSTLRDSKKVRTRVCGTRSFVVNAGFSNAMAGSGSAQTETSYFAMYTTDDVSDLQVGFTNPTNGIETRIKAAIDIGGIIYKLHFNGNRFATVSTGGVLFTDPLGFFIAKGTLVKVRTFADAGTGLQLRANRTNFDTGGGGSTASSDLADSGAIGDQGTCNIFGPSLLIGKCSNPAVLVLGDSIANGSSGFEDEGGWPVRAFGTSIARNSGNNANVLNLGISAGKATMLKDADRYWRGQLYKYCDIAICNFGANDVNQTSDTIATISANLLSLWNDLSRRGLKVWQGTITPVTTSTDSWATTGNQTAIKQATFAGLNNYIRTTPSPLTGYIEIADTVMTARDSGIWKAPSWTSDGIHPFAFSGNPQAQNALAAAMPVDILTRETPITALLTSIVLTTGTLSPVFAAGTFAYTTSVTVASITLRTVFDGGYNTVKVNGVEISSGALTDAIPLTIGTNTITIAVAARNGTSTSTYTITVTRTA